MEKKINLENIKESIQESDENKIQINNQKNFENLNNTNAEKNINIEDSANNSNKKCICSLSKGAILTLIIMAVVFIVIGIILVCFFIILKHEDKANKDIEEIINDYLINNEFEILTMPGDLKQITVIQKSLEEYLLNGTKISNNIVRKTNYDIYFLSVTRPEKKEKIFYSKMYQGVVTIRSECTEEGDDCEPKELVDLIKAKDYNLRNLQNKDIYKDKPIALCLFNITDNNVITTFICPESLSYVKRNEIILDLYFFRPPAAERADKLGDNITLEMKKDEKTKKTFIHETNGGFCNIYNNWASHCTTEMNTTLDKYNNLLTYDEQAYTFINYDERNTFTKNKITKLVDISENIKPEDIINYEKSFNNLLPLLEPYMEEEVQFTEKDYEDLYNIINDKKKSPELQSYSPKKIKKTFRKLAREKIQQIKQADLFNDRITPIQVDLALKINSGINSEITGAYAGIIYDETEINFSSIEENSKINQLLEKLSQISKAGNSLASELYDKIYYKLEDLANNLSIKINTLEDYLKYYDLMDVFDSILISYSYKQLPSDIARLSNELVESLSDIYNNIKSSDIKYNAEILRNDIYSYINRIHELIRKMLNNFSNLSEIFIAKNNNFTVITNYYLNNTSFSYYDIIRKIKTILETYFISEYNTIYPKMEEIMELLEQNNNDTLLSYLTSLRNLYSNLYEQISDNNYQSVLNNLENSIQYPFNIIKSIKEYLNEIMNIKSNGYFISNEDIKSFSESFSNIILEAEKVLKNLDNNNIIDLVFDEIMIKFKDNYINIINYMEQIKSGNFTLEEDVLNNTLFSKDEKNKIENELKAVCDRVLEKIKDQNDNFIKKIKTYFDTFLNDNLDKLNEIILDLSLIFSEEALQTLSDSFENSLNLSLNKFNKITLDNINLTEKYINHYYDMIRDEDALKKLIQNYYLDYNEIYRPHYDRSQTHQFPILDVLYGKMRTSAYLSKFNTFMANLNYTEEYLINQLNYSITNEYKELFTKIKEELTSIINNKLNEKFPDFYEVNFFDNHIKIIDKLSTRLDKYFSEEIFKNKYKKIIDENINNNLNLIRNSKNEILAKNNYIKTFPIFSDNTNDMCITFKRKVCYGCTNCVSFTFFYDRFCFILKPYDSNYLELKKNIYESVNNFGQFDGVFNTLNYLIKEKVDRYNHIVENLDLNISYIKNETYNENINLNYLEPINDYIDELLKEKFENVLLRYTHNYYKSTMNEKFELMFKDIFEKWRKAYNTLVEDILSHSDNITYSNFEFTVIAENYQNLIQVNQTEDYYNSIILFERAEFNYTLSYYYNYLMKLIKKSFNYMKQNIEMYENDYNEILKERKVEIKNLFDNLEVKIAKSENKILILENQLNILNVNDNDFFEVKSILRNNVLETENELLKIIDKIWSFEMFLPPGDKYTLVMKYYLENKELGKLIEEYFEKFDLYLDLNKFKEILINNFVFNNEDFINIINKALYSTNIEIKNELFVKLEEYFNPIEDDIKTFYDDDIENIINDLFSNAIKETNIIQKDNIKNYISNSINNFRNLIKTEANRIKNSGGTYLLNIDNIKQKFKIFANNIKIEIDASIFDILDKFNDNIYQNLYLNCFKNKFETYLTQIRNIISLEEYKNYTLLNTSFNIGEIIYNLTKDVINNYENIIKKKIGMKYNEYYSKIKSDINLSMLHNLIQDDINNIFQTELLPFLTEQNNCTTCSEYNIALTTRQSINNLMMDLSNDIKNEMSLLKGDNYQANFQCLLDFTNSGINVIKPICDSMKLFLSFENEEQITKINENIRNIIQNNLEDFLNTIIPNFGNEFFERIIDYNINFKLSSLYENLINAIKQTLLYYEALEVIAAESDLPSDLKNRLINLNDLDITVLDNVYEIKKLTEEKLNELINDLKYEAKNAYIHYIKEDEAIKNSFSSNVFEKIDYTLQKIMPDLEKEYQKALEKYLKEKFMKDFFDSLDEKTNNLLNIFHEQKEILTQRLNLLFSNDKDEEINEINTNINIIIESIQDYKNFTRNFSLTQNAKDFFINYPKNNLLPIYNTFNKDLYNDMKQSIITEINNKSKEIENLDILKFKYKLNVIYNESNNDYMNLIYNKLNEICGTEYTYKNKLKNKIKSNQIYNGRRLKIIDTFDEEDIIDEIKQMYESKYIEDSMELLVNKTRNVKNYIQTINTFISYSNIIRKYQFNLNIDYKNISARIGQNKYENEINKFLMEKLKKLTEKLYFYYKEINSNFYVLHSDLIETIINIQNNLDSCYNYMADVLNNQYQIISLSTEKVNKTISNYREEYPERLKYKHQSENMMINGTTYISKLNEYVNFNLDLNLEHNKIYIPRIKARIESRTVPKNIVLSVITGYGFCYQKGHRFNISFGDVNYTMTVEYDTKTSYINITTYTNIKDYNYTILVSRSRGETTSERISMDNYIRIFSCKNIDRYLDQELKIFVPEKTINESSIIFK